MGSQYDLIQFVLLAAKSYQGDWEEFMKKTYKMCKGRIPEGLLNGLKRQGLPELDEECDRYLVLSRKNAERAKLQKEQHAEKQKQWIEKRNRGNHLELQKRKQAREYLLQVQQVQKELDRQQKQKDWTIERPSILS